MTDGKVADFMEEFNKKAELFEALAQAQAEFTPVETDKKVDFKAKNSRVKYDYASFAAIFKMAQKPLTNHGLSVFQIMQNGDLITTLAHKSGQTITSIAPLPPSNDIKQFGASLSYLRRYQYTAIVGAVVTDEDNENKVEDEIQQTKNQKPAAKQSQADNGSDPWPAKNGVVFEFCKKVRENTSYFKNQHHLQNTVGGFGSWLKNEDEFNAKLDAALSHANEKAEQPNEEFLKTHQDTDDLGLEARG